MKARYFKKLRKKAQWFDVDTTNSLFGKFRFNWNGSVRVLARNSREACIRAKRRGYGLTKVISDEKITENWARWRVKLSDKSDNFKNISYF